jgi:hypothetical protein
MISNAAKELQSSTTNEDGDAFVDEENRNVMATNRWGGRSNELIEEILEVVSDNNREALRAMFSEKALSEATYFNEGVEYLFELIQGGVISYEQRSLPSSVRTRTSGRLTFEKSDSTYVVTTDKDVYLIAFSVYFIDDSNPENVGVYKIAAIRADDEEKLRPWRNWEIPGICQPN